MTATGKSFMRFGYMKYTGHIAGLVLVACLGGCTSTYVSPVEVTRFTGSRPSELASGTISIAAAPGLPSDAWVDSAFQSAVAAELAQLGYSVTADGAAQVAEVVVERGVMQPGNSRSPVSVGVGGSTGTGYYRGGVGMGVGIDLTPRPSDQVATRLRVVIRPADGGDALWEGRAQFTASTNSDYADQRTAAAKMADALFTGFPGNSGETIEVK